MQQYWHYFGDIDLFGLPVESAEALLQSIGDEAITHGGDFQVTRLHNQLDTQRYRVATLWPMAAAPLAVLLHGLLGELPEDHPAMTIHGYDHTNCERADIILRGGNVYLQAYTWQPGETALLYGEDTEELTREAVLAEEAFAART